MDHIILFGDIFYYHIINYLLPIDLYHLVLTCKNYQSHITVTHIKKNTINELKKRLYHIFDTKYDLFSKLMIDTHSVISGSCIIQSILGEHWPKSDINIFVPILDIDNIYSKNCKFSKIDDFMSKYFRCIYRKTNYYVDCNIKIVRKYIDNKQNKIKVVLVDIYKDCGDMQRFMEKLLDFDIYKNIYDIYQNDISITNIQGIFNKEYKNHMPGKYIKRCKKYESLGFTLKN